MHFITYKIELRERRIFNLIFSGCMSGAMILAKVNNLTELTSIQI